MSRLAIALLLISSPLAGPLWAEEDGGVVIIRPRVVVEPAPDDRAAAGDATPGRAAPVFAAEPKAFEVDWDDYRTLIVIEEAGAKRARAWVATRRRSDGDLQVAYTGTAFVDAAGDIHIDCQNAAIAGPAARHWSPDSFAIEDDGHVRVIDDANRGNPGRLSASGGPGDADKGHAKSQGSLDYRAARLLARFYIDGSF